MDDITRRSQKNLSTILSCMQLVGQKRVAELIGESETTVSRCKGDLERCAAIIAACGLKVVPLDHKTYSEERIKALNVLAKIGLEADVASEWGVLDD